MDRPSNYPRSNPVRIERSKELDRLNYWFVAFFLLNLCLSLPHCAWYVFTNYLLGEIEMPAEDFYQAGLISAVFNIVIVSYPWIKMARLTKKPLWHGVAYSLVTALASVFCLASVPLAFGMAKIATENRIAKDIETTVGSEPL